MDVIFGIDSAETFTNVITDILDNLYLSKPISCAENIEPNIVQSTKEDLKKILTTCDFDINQVSEMIKAKGWEPEKVKTFTSLIEKKKEEILYSALVHNNSLHGETVSEFDWVLKLVCGTNSLKTMRYPLLQMILNTMDPNGDQKPRVYDINKEMLDKFINNLENIIKSIPNNGS